MAETGRMAVFHGAGKPFEIREYPVPDPGQGAILIKIALANICGSDLHYWRGELDYRKMGRPLPLNTGHEHVGTVAKLGPGVTTDSTGHFSFTGSPPHNAVYFATAPTRPKATSGQVGVQVANRVTVRLSTAHPRRGHKVVFRGTVGPAHNGELVRIQKRVGSHWRTVKSAILGPVRGTARLSQYRVGVRIRRKGVYRAYVAGDATNVAGASRRRVIRPR